MSIFRTALRVAAAHPIYLTVYVVFLSLLGVLVIGDLGTGAAAAASGPAFEARVAVVDRDGSELSGALVSWAKKNAEVVTVDDEPLALQDSVATGAVDCLVVLPAGFEEDLIADARAGRDPAPLEVAYGTDVQAGALAATATSRWVSLAAQAAALEPDATASEVASLALAVADERVDMSVDSTGTEDATGSGLAVYLRFSTYSVMSSIVVVAGVTLAAYQRPEIRRRNAAAPVAPARLASGELGACCVLVACVWAWTCLVGVVACRGSLTGVDPLLVGLALLSMLPFALVPLAIAFLLAQLGLSEQALNAVGNIGAMVLSFLGGAWVPLALLPAGVQAAARLSPSFWASSAVEAALGANGVTPALLAEVSTSVGIVALFAVAICAAGLAVGRARRRVAGAA